MNSGTSLSAWQSFGGICLFCTSVWLAVKTTIAKELLLDPDAITIGASSLHCFAIGLDSCLWHKTHDVNEAVSNYAGWESLKGICLSAPYVTSWGPDHIAVFVAGADRAAWSCQWTRGGQWVWTSVGGRFPNDSLTACCWGEGRIDLFGVGTDNILQHTVCYCYFA